MVKGYCLVALALVLSTAACAPASEAGRGTGPANGRLIIGTAARTLATSVFFQTRRFTVTLAGTGGQTVAVSHRGCTSYDGLFAGEPCTRETEPGWQVLELPPGDWRAVGVHLDVRSGFPAQEGTVDVALPPGIGFPVGPGEVVYVGDFVFGVDPVTRTGTVLSHGRDDGGASRALAAVPGSTGFTYREPG